MRPPRFRLRSMMILVAVLALSLSAAVLWRRREHYRRLAEAYALTEMVLRVDSNMARGSAAFPLLDLSESMDRNARQADYYARLRRKYERAARRPWLPVEADPPEPR